MVNLKLLKLACADCRVATLCLPRGLDREDMERLDGIVKRGPPLQRGQYLYRQGDPMRALFTVRAGSLRVFTSTPEGTEQTVGFYLLGEVLGFDGLERDRHTCAALALETTAVCELPLERLEELCAQLPRL
jgi:CRP/FNR family transcriptional regulator